MRSPVYEPLAVDDPRQIGGYRIAARLGAGGMGRVYLGLTQSGRRLAIKVIRPEFADDPEFRRRFAQEVTAAQRVQSLYTAPVIDADLNGPEPWLATAHIAGPSLGTVLFESGPLPVDTVRTLAAGIAEALQAIHRAGVVHRDLKPSNVLLAADGPRVIDFGIARAADATPLTRTGGAIGSPQFMAPEQVLGHSSTPALDVFAFGSLVHCAATGQSPFGQGPAQAVMYRITTEEPHLDGCPPELRPLVAQCLAKDPAERPTTAQIIADLTDSPDPVTSAWLPEAIVTSLAPYDQVPTPPPPSPPFATTVPPTIGLPPAPGTPTPPPPHGQAWPSSPTAAPPAQRGNSPALMILAAAAGVLVVLLAVILAVVLSSGDDETPSRDIAQSPSTAPPQAQQPTAETTGPQEGSSEPSTTSTPAPDAGPDNGVKPPGTFLDEYKGIGITGGYGITFLDDPKRPKEGDSGDFDFYFDGSYLWGDNFAYIDVSAKGDYNTCHDTTLYEGHAMSSPGAGSRLCVYTAEGLLGIVKIKSLDSSHLVIDLQVWQGPADR
ncbi:serine/threonine protein kinase [Actinocorallia herbida]|uniref:Serine/threonine protein kinase n=1 Tax=Actinocorallia herbida TaxID=58109 RepID=A0A3N1CZQ9_9ACTN|nr:serine/threonine-protein kinase [Actinocorallia herbida]ROO86759.1 serine/threonine protein kinase [Actinocorallia herbida]